MIGSMFALKGLRREEAKKSPPNTLSTSAKVAIVFVGLVIAASIVRGSQLGMSEGALRNPAPGIYLVDAENNAEGWTVVSNDEYQRWSAIFVRGLTPLALFGLVLVRVGLNFLGMHRMALEAEQATDVGMGPSVGGPFTGGPYRVGPP